MSFSVSMYLNEPDSKRMLKLLQKLWPELAEKLRCNLFRQYFFEAVLTIYDDDNNYPPDNPTNEDVIEFKARAIAAAAPFRDLFEACPKCEGHGLTIGRNSDSEYWERYVHDDEIDWDVCDCVKPVSTWKPS